MNSFTKAYDKIKQEVYLIKLEENTIEGVTIDYFKAATAFETFDLCHTKNKKTSSNKIY